MNEFIEPNGSMFWATVLALLLVFIPNFIRLFSVSKDFMGFLPQYLQWIREDPSALESEDTRTRLGNSFTVIFGVIQIHAANVLACGILGWSLWLGQIPSLAPWLEAMIFWLAIASIGGNFIIVYGRTKKYLGVRKVYRLLGGIREPWKTAEENPDTESISMTDTVYIWGGIGLHILSAVLLAILVYLL